MRTATPGGRLGRLSAKERVGLGALLVGAVLLGLCVGAVSLSPWALVRALMRAPLEGWDGAPELWPLVFLRLPRVILALEVGGALALSGLAMQALFRNPLADPGLLGTSSGAALGAVCAIMVGAVHPLFIPGSGFVGALAATVLASVVARGEHEGMTARLLLAGIAINALCWTGVGFATYLATEAQLRSITFWNLGSLSGTTWGSLGAASLPMWLGAGLLLRHLRHLSLMLLGEREAGHLGVDVHTVKWQVVMGCALVVAGAVSAAGVIGFIGIVIPALLRLVLGPDVGRMALPSVISGGALLLLADLLARTTVVPAELPVGLLTTALGTPVFVYLLMRKREGFA